MIGNAAPHAFKQADPCSLVVFGASGDLMHRLLFPALYNLAAGSLLPDAFALIGVGRSEMSDDALREDLRKSLQQFATRPVEEKLARRSPIASCLFRWGVETLEGVPGFRVSPGVPELDIFRQANHRCMARFLDHQLPRARTKLCSERRAPSLFAGRDPMNGARESEL